jgi:hypothetical protein
MTNTVLSLLCYINKTLLNISGYQTKYNEMGETGNMRDMTSAYENLFSKPEEEAHLGVLSVDTKFCSHRQQILYHIHINFQTPVCRALNLNRLFMVFHSLKINKATVPQIMSQPLHDTLFTIHYFLIILPYNTN